jgi:hypothetical protein
MFDELPLSDSILVRCSELIGSNALPTNRAVRKHFQDPPEITAPAEIIDIADYRGQTAIPAQNVYGSFQR